MDFRHLFQLQDEHASFKTQSQVNRFLYATLLGLWFHLLYQSFDLKMLDWKAFLILDLVFVVTLIYHERVTYTRPINVSVLSAVTENVANDMGE